LATQRDADRCVWEETQQYLKLPYAELLQVARRQRRVGRGLSGWRSCSGDDAFLDVSISELRWLRRRVAVELILSVTGQDGARISSVAYFERFRSGKLRGPWCAYKGVEALQQ